MKFDPLEHHRQSLRLSGYDYSQAGGYFVTIVTWQKDCLFGEIVEGIMRLGPVGQIIYKEWQRLPLRFTGLVLDEFSVMPNHIHGIIIFPGDDFLGSVNSQPEKLKPLDSPLYPPASNGVEHPEPSLGLKGHEFLPFIKPGSLAAIVRAYKSSTTLRFNRTRFAKGAPLWQRNYYEHIVRHESDLNRIRQYIQDNPINWTMDEENRANHAISK